MKGLGKRFASLLLARGRRFAAVDFDSRRLRVVLAEQTAGGTRIRNATSVPLGENLKTDDPEGLGRLLAKALKDMAFRGNGVLMSVPRSEAVLKPLSLPPGTLPQEIPSMVHYQVAKELPFPVEDAVIDFTVEPSAAQAVRRDAPGGQAEGEDKAAQEVKILVAAIRLHVIDYYRRIAAAANLTLLRLGLRPYANLCCVEASEVRAGRDNLALVHITANETEIDLISHGSLVFSRSAVMDLVGPTGLADKGADKAANALVSEVSRSLQSYLAVERGAHIEAVLLAGETGLESRVAEMLPVRLHVPCEPLRTELLFPDQQPKPVSSAFISALGLAVGHAAGEGLPFDFLNPKRPQAKRNVGKIRAVAAAAGIAVLVMAAIVARAVVIGGLKKDVAGLNRQYAAIEAEVKEAKKAADRAETMEKWTGQGRRWLDHWANISGLLPSAKDVYLAKLSTSEDGTIGFTVQATSSQAITELNRKLEEAGYQLKPGRTKSGTDSFGYVYSTTVQVKADPDTTVDLAKVQPEPRPADDSTPEQFTESQSPANRRNASPARPVPATPPAGPSTNPPQPVPGAVTPPPGPGVTTPAPAPGATTPPARPGGPQTKPSGRPPSSRRAGR